VIEPLLFTAVRVTTFAANQQLTNASGFFFERDDRLFVVTSRHVLADRPSRHFPDRIEIELHLDPKNVACSGYFSIPLYERARSVWREESDTSGVVDVAAIEIDKSALPSNVAYRAFGPEQLADGYDQFEVGTSLLVVGFPLGFHDTLHHMPVARHAAIASSFGLRFQGEGYFLTDGRTHRGMSGAPVIARRPTAEAGSELHFVLLGVHSARIDVGTRDLSMDEALGLNSAWYADILLKLTA